MLCYSVSICITLIFAFKEFRRLARKYSLTVDLVPIEDHDDYYSGDDIEIWRVKKSGNSFKEREIVRRSLNLLSWGNIDVVSCDINGMLIPIKQDTSGSIGCMLWSSSVVLSRYLINILHSAHFI